MSGRGILIGIAVGVIGAVLVGQVGTGGGSFRSSAPLTSDPHAAALAQLQNALAAEVQSRRELADRIAELDTQLSLLRLMNDETNGNPLARSETAPTNSIPEKDESAETRTILGVKVENTRFDDEALLSRGVHPRDVARLHDRWVRYELDRQAITDSALREGWFFTDRHRAALAQSDRELREDLPDADYDRYLYALEKPNRLVAREVLEGSTADEAGLRRGDVILHYDDVRMFDLGEILKASSQGDPGESVPLGILRDGERQTVYVERGPLGVILEHSRGEPLAD